MPGRGLTYDGAGFWRGAGGVVIPSDTSTGGGGGAVDRDLLVPGTYKPDDTNTGLLPDVPLTPHFGNITAVNGQIIQNLDIHGRVTGNATDVSIKNCRIRGDTPVTGGDSGKGMVQTVNATPRRWLIEDCLIQPDIPHNTFNGFLGHDYTARRCRLINCSDGFGIFNTTNPNGPVNVTLEANWVDNLYFIRPSDTGTRPEGTHNDCLQIQGGSGIRVVGNRFDAYINPALGSASSQDPVTGNQYYPWMTANAAVMISPNVGVVSDVVFDRNWMNGGATLINVVEQGRGPITSMFITNNIFDHGQRVGRQALIVATTYDLTTISGNVFADGVGTPRIVRS